MRSKVCIFNEFGESSYYLTSDAGNKSAGL